MKKCLKLLVGKSLRILTNEKFKAPSSATAFYKLIGLPWDMVSTLLDKVIERESSLSEVTNLALARKADARCRTYIISHVRSTYNPEFTGEEWKDFVDRWPSLSSESEKHTALFAK